MFQFGIPALPPAADVEKDAQHGLGVAIVPAFVPRDRPDLHAVDIVPELRGRLVLVWRAAGPVSPAARVLIERARRLLSVSARA